MPIWSKVNNKRKRIYTKFKVITDTHFYSTSDGDPDSTDGLGAIYEVSNGDEWHLYAGSAKFKHFVDACNNDDDCDFVFHLGDMVQDSDQATWDIFLNNWADINKPKDYTIGNHDILHGNSYSSILSILGKGSDASTAGSVFNKSFAIGDVRVIMFDSNINNSGEHEGSGSGWLQTDALNWIEQELLASEQKNILMVTHHGPHSYNVNKFDQSQAEAYKNTLLDVAASRNLKINTIFGHHHPQKAERFRTLDAKLPGWCLGANLLFNPGYYADLYLYEDGNMVINDIPVAYPYP